MQRMSGPKHCSYLSSKIGKLYSTKKNFNKGIVCVGQDDIVEWGTRAGVWVTQFPGQHIGPTNLQFLSASFAPFLHGDEKKIAASSMRKLGKIDYVDAPSLSSGFLREGGGRVNYIISF